MKCGFGLVSARTGITVPMKAIDVQVTVLGFVANVEASLTYANNKPDQVEAVYVFPVDEESALYKFEAEIDGRRIVAECQEKDQARETYKDAVAAGHTAMLLEENDASGDIFQCMLGNLPPREDIKLQIAYVAKLTLQADGSVKFVLPSVLNPRYDPDVGTDVGVGAHLPVAACLQRLEYRYHPCNNEQPYKFTFSANISSHHEIKKVTSEKEKLLMTSLKVGDLHKFELNLSEKVYYKHDLTFFIFYEDVNKPEGILEKGGPSQAKWPLLKQDVLMLNFYPDLLQEGTSTCGEFIFIIDRSGSMNGQKMSDAKEALLLFLKSLAVGCYFNVVSFGRRYTSLFPDGSQEYNKESLTIAMELQKNMDADMGGTEILSPLEHVYSRKKIQGHPRQIFLLTDGQVWNVQSIVSLVKKNAHDTRVFTVGIGQGASTTLVSGVARAGKGQAEFVEGKNKLQQKVVNLLKWARQPSVTDVKLELELPGGLMEWINFPREIPPIFCGQRLILYKFIKGEVRKGKPSEGKGTLSGKVGSGVFHHVVKIDFNDVLQNPSELLVHRLAAKSLIKELEMVEKEEDKQNKKREIVLASKSMNVISKYTSFIGVDKDSRKRLDQQAAAYGNTEYEVPCVPGPERKNKCALSMEGKARERIKVEYAGLDDSKFVFEGMIRKRKRSKAAAAVTVETSPSSMDIIAIQSFDGSWDLSDNFSSAIGVPLEQLEKDAPVENLSVWATVVAIAWLRKNWSMEKDQWEMIVNKACDWLSKQPLEGSTVEELIEKASDKLM